MTSPRGQGGKKEKPSRTPSQRFSLTGVDYSARWPTCAEARRGRNPQTGEIITIPAKRKRTVVKVLLLKALKEVVK
jgi:hypothetical protein